MEIMEYIFYLGVVYIVFSMIWGFFMLILNMVTMGQRKGIFEEYLLRTSKYYFIVALTVMVTQFPDRMPDLTAVQMNITGLIVLFLYLLGKVQSNRMRFKIQSGVMGNLNVRAEKPNPKVELAFLLGSLVLYSLCIAEPKVALNDITLWFFNAIWDIYDTIIIGWIIKIIGFFFLLSILFRAIAVIQVCIAKLNGTDTKQNNTRQQQDYDDFEVMDDENSNDNNNPPKELP
jgi:hypothetical protein